jgi:hypothetical protein
MKLPYFRLHLYEWLPTDKSIIQISTAWNIRALFGIYLLDSIDNSLRQYVTCYIDILFFRIKVLIVEV